MDYNDLSDDDKLIYLKQKIESEENYLSMASNPKTIKMRRGNIKMYKKIMSELKEKIGLK